ncbi:HAD family hydrolase [Corynebacterium sp. 335C]
MLVVWDIDLTLLQPNRFGHGCAEEVIAARGGSVPADLVFAGRTDHAIWGEALARSGVPAAELPGVLADYGRACAAAPWEGRVLPGAREALAAAAAVASAQTVVTGNVRATAELKLRHAGFAVAGAVAGGSGVSRDDVPRPGSSPAAAAGPVLDLGLGSFGDESDDRAALLASTLERWRGRVRAGGAVGGAGGAVGGAGGAVGGAGGAVGGGVACGDARAVAVGDTVHDVAAALACGAGMVAVATGPDDAARLRDAGAHAVLPDLRDAGAVVAALRAAAR